MTSQSPSPFFYARKHADGVTVRGQLSCELGHRLWSENQQAPDGVFAGWTWDGQTLAVKNDRYGFYPLFYYSRGNEFAISPSLVKLLDEGAPLDVDVDALAVFLHLGFFIANDTPFQCIKAVPPNTCFRWDGNLELHESRHLGGALEISRADAVEEYARLFRRSVAKRLPQTKDFAVPLSGGRDSRHILFELCEANYRPAYCITASRYGSGDDDVSVAKLLTKTLGLKHVVVERPPRLEAELRTNVATNFCADEHAWFVPVGDYLAGTVKTIYDGIAGDVLSASLFQNQAWLDLYRAGRIGELADVLIRRSTDMIQQTLDPAFRAAGSTQTARERVTQELERYAGAANPLTMFFFWNRTRREIALVPFGIFSGVETCFCPYLDHDLFDFLTSLPSEITLDKMFHTETISRAYPKFAGLPYSRTGRGTTMLGTATLGARVMSYGVRGKPVRIGRFARVASQAFRFILSPSYRRRNRVINPARLLYFCQLEDVRREAAFALGSTRTTTT